MKTASYFLLFFGIFFVIYLGIHFATYGSILYFFDIVDLHHKYFFAGFLGILGLSFLISSVMAHWGDNRIMRLYYLISGIWVGFVINLFVFLIFAWAVEIALLFTGISGYKILIGSISIGAALVYTIYGVWNARSVQIKEMEVAIKNLPESWRGKKVLHIADIHLGYVFRDIFFKHIVEKINELKADVVVITGDLFDGTNIDVNWFIEPLNKIKASEAILYVSGNHETYLGIDSVYEMLNKTKVKVLKDEIYESRGLQFVGIEYPHPGQKKDVSLVMRGIEGYDENEPGILLIHEPAQIEQAKKMGISLQLSGHTHKGQVFPFSLVTKMIYKRYHYGLTQEESFTLYTTSGVGAWGPPLRTGSKPEIAIITLV